MIGEISPWIDQTLLGKCLIVQCVTPFSTAFQLYRRGQCTYPCFCGVLLTSTPRNILSMPLAAFPNNYCRNNGQRWDRNESCRNDYHQSSERILVELADQTSNFLFSSLHLYRLSYGTRLSRNVENAHYWQFLTCCNLLPISPFLLTVMVHLNTVGNGVNPFCPF